MNSNLRIVVIITGVLTGMVGCSHAPLSKDFNESNSNNIAIQTVNPYASKTEAPMATLDGAKAEHLLQRYRTDTGKAESGAIVTGVSSSK
jgi:type IV pilus biogenesis protein CpaD/CtpE